MGRTYEIQTDKGTVKYPSVTTILSHVKQIPGQYYANTVIEYIKDNLEGIKSGAIPLDDTLFDLARKYHHEKLEKAGDIGTATHNAIEMYITTSILGSSMPATLSLLAATLDDSVARPFSAFVDWVEDMDFEPMYSELTVYSHNLNYAGTLDCVARLNGKIYVLDFKTSKAHYPENGLQIAAYRHAYEEMGLGKIEGCGILRLDKETGLPDWKDYSQNYDRHLDAFKGILLYHYNVRNRRTSQANCVKVV